MVRLLIQNGADPNKEDSTLDLPLGVAITQEQKAIAIQLIEAGANINKPTGWDKTPMLSLAVAKKDEQMVRLLIQNGANATPDWAGPGPSTLLAAAVATENESILRLLLQAGADCQVHTPDRNSLNERLPLMTAIETRNLEVARLLLEFGADIEM